MKCLHDSTSLLFLSDESEKDKIWDKHRELTEHLMNIYKGSGHDDLKKQATRMIDCAPWLSFNLEKQDGKEDTRHKLSQAFFCHVRTCPVCAWRKSLCNKARFINALPKVMQENDCENATFLFLTLTVRNCDIHDLRSTIQMMNQGWKRMIDLLMKQCPWLLGWVLSTEVTRSDSEQGNAHPHFHVLLMVKPAYFKKGYIKQSDWIALWKRSARLDYDPSVHVEGIKGRRSKKGLDKTAVQASSAEALKYATTYDEEVLADADWCIEYARQIKRLKFVRTGGILNGILKDEYTDEELTQGDEETQEQEEALPLQVRYFFERMFGRYARPKQRKA